MKKRNLKAIFAALMVGAMALSFAACGNKDADTPADGGDAQTQTQDPAAQDGANTPDTQDTPDVGETDPKDTPETETPANPDDVTPPADDANAADAQDAKEMPNDGAQDASGQDGSTLTPADDAAAAQ